MKKILTTLICVLLVASIAIGLFACSPAPTDPDVDVQKIFDEALAKYASGANYTKETTYQSFTGQDGKSTLFNNVLRVDGEDTDEVNVLETYDEKGNLSDTYIKESYRRNNAVYQWTDVFSSDRIPALGYERKDEGFTGYVRNPGWDSNDAWVYDEYERFFLSAAANYVFDGNEVTKNQNGGYDFNLSIDLVPVVSALLDLDKSKGSYIDGILAALGFDITAKSVFELVGTAVNDTVTVSGFRQKVDEILKGISPTFSFEMIFDYYVYQQDRDAYWVYDELRDYGAEVEKPRPADSAKTYLDRIFEVYGDKLLKDFLLSNSADMSLAAKLKIKETTLYNTKMIENPEIMLFILQNFVQMDGSLGDLLMKLYQSAEDAMDDINKIFPRLKEILPLLFKELTVCLTISTNAANEITDISADFAARFDGTKYIYAGIEHFHSIFSNLGFDYYLNGPYEFKSNPISTPVWMDLSDTLFDAEKDNVVTLMAVTAIQYFMGGCKMPEDLYEDYWYPYFEYTGGGMTDSVILYVAKYVHWMLTVPEYTGEATYKLSYKASFSNYGTTELVRTNKLSTGGDFLYLTDTMEPEFERANRVMNLASPTMKIFIKRIMENLPS